MVTDFSLGYFFKCMEPDDQDELLSNATSDDMTIGNVWDQIWYHLPDYIRDPLYGITRNQLITNLRAGKLQADPIV